MHLLAISRGKILIPTHPRGPILPTSFGVRKLLSGGLVDYDHKYDDKRVRN